MRITLLGATGALGSECLVQALEAGHQLTVLVRSAAKLPEQLRPQITVVEGDALNTDDIAKVLDADTEVILFAIGVDRQSPENLCTNVTRLVFEHMRRLGIRRFVWCGGGSTFVEEDQITLGARLVEKFAAAFMPLRHFDKTHQYQYLQENRDIDWLGVRPLQMRKGPRRGQYRLGFNSFGSTSKISFADCAQAMIQMLEDDSWLGKAPIIQY